MRNLVLLGGGYGNMRIIHRLLPNQLPDDVMITLIDKNPYHCLKTEYYALAAGTISDHHIRVSFPDHPKLKIEYGTISSVDLEGKKFCFMTESRYLMMTPSSDSAVKINITMFPGRLNIPTAFRQSINHAARTRRSTT